VLDKMRRENQEVWQSTIKMANSIFEDLERLKREKGGL
jgi:hypothetical protein